MTGNRTLVSIMGWNQDYAIIFEIDISTVILSQKDLNESFCHGLKLTYYQNIDFTKLYRVNKLQFFLLLQNNYIFIKEQPSLSQGQIS